MPAGFRTRPKTARTDLVPMSDVLRFCRGAAALALKGEKWSGEDRADVAAQLVCQVWEKAVSQRANTSAVEVAPTSLAGPAPKMPKGKIAKSAPKARMTVDAVPASLCKGSDLYGAASNIKRAMISERDRLEKVGAERARSHGFRTGNVGAYPEGIPADPAAAHTHTRQILCDLGVARLGKLYPAAYAACREAAGMTGAEIADELGISAGSLKRLRSTSAQLLPSAQVYGAQVHADALRVDEYAPPLRTLDAVLPESNGERIRPGHAFPNVPGAIVPVAPVAAFSVRGGRRKWDGESGAEWTRRLSAPLRGKLAQGARNQRDRMAGKSEADRQRDRLQAGIPAKKGQRALDGYRDAAPAPMARYVNGARVAGENVGGAQVRRPFTLPAVAPARRRNGPGVPRMPEREQGACRCEQGAPCSVHTWRLPVAHVPAAWQAPATAASAQVAAELGAAKAPRAKRAKRQAPRQLRRPVPRQRRTKAPAKRYGAGTPWQGQRIVRRPESAPRATAYQRACHAMRRDLAEWARECEREARESARA